MKPIIRKMVSRLLVLVMTLASLGITAQTKSPKRGFCGDLLNSADLLAASNYAWYYNWGQAAVPAVAGTVKNYIDYVPMAWGASYSRTALRSYLTNHPEVKYLLGFNEPNFKEQANIGPRAAASLWPELEKIADEFNLELVSPALNFSYVGGAVIENGIEYTDPIRYLDDFFAALPDTSRVDYVAIHGYFDNAGALPWYVGLYDKYNKPVWLTEFNHSASGVTETSQQNFMVEALSYLEKEPKVFRYAWFLGRNSQTNTNLFKTGTTGVLTDLGLIMAHMSTYDGSYYHTAGDTMQAEHYLDMKGVHLIKAQDANGILAAHDFDAGDWMDYNVDVAEAGDYTLDLRITSVWASSLKVYSNNALLGTFQTPITGGLETWQTIPVDVALPAGKQKIRIVTNAGGWKLNWLKLSLPTNTDVMDARSQTRFSIFPGLVSSSGQLTIDTNTTDYTIEIIDVQGIVVMKTKHHHGIDTLGLPALKSGTYIVRATSPDGVFIKRFAVKI